MRTHQVLKSILTLGTVVLALSSGAARPLSPLVPDTGYQGPLINRPACLIVPSPPKGLSACWNDSQAHRIESPWD
jgi:hypothetical protein